MTKDDQKKLRDSRLAELGLRQNAGNGANARCIHCGQPFKLHESTGAEVGICQQCIDD